MADKDLKKIWPEWEIVGELGSGTHGKSYLAKKTTERGGTLYRTIKEVQIAPQKGAVQTALDLGISVEALEDYFDVFKGDMDWELSIYRMADSDKLSKNEAFVILDSDKEPGWTGYVRRNLYTPVNEYYGDKLTGENEAVRIGKDICEALIACEDMYMVHGGVSYSNVLLDDKGKAVLVDYGVKRCTSKAGVKLFAPIHQFDAPEVIANGEYTKYSDIYSLGMTLAAIANGGTLKSSKNLRNVFSPRFAQVIEKAIAKNSWDRYRSAEEMLDALRRITTYQSVENNRSAVQQALLDAHGQLIVRPKSAPKTNGTVVRRVVIVRPRIERLNGTTIYPEPKVTLKAKSAEPEKKPVIDVAYEHVNAPYEEVGLSPEQELAAAQKARQQAEDALFSHAQPEKEQKTPEKDHVSEHFSPIEDLFEDNQPQPESVPQQPEQIKSEEAQSMPEPIIEHEPVREEPPTVTDQAETQPIQRETESFRNDIDMFLGRKDEPESYDRPRHDAGRRNSDVGFKLNWRIMTVATAIVAAAVLLVIFKPWNRNKHAEIEQPPAIVQPSDETEQPTTQPEDTQEITVPPETEQPTQEQQPEVEQPTEQEQPTEELTEEQQTEQPTQEPEEQPQDTQTEPEAEPDPTAEFLATYTAPEYIFDQRVISESELEGKDKIETTVLLNSIFARHGKVFEDPAMQAFFEAQSWYTANDDGRDFTAEFTRSEISNMNIIIEYQKKMGYR